MKNKGQVTIFIIVAVVIIAAIALFLIFRGEQTPITPGAPESNPRAFIEGCIEDEMRNNINLVLSQGGFIDPKNYHMFDDNKVAYLCYNRGYFKPCINQHPMFLNEMSEELKNEISPIIGECFDRLKDGLEKQGYEIEIGELIETDLGITFGQVYLEITRDVTITKNEETSSLNEMRLTYPSSIYNLAIIANHITNSESEYCYFEYLGYMTLNPKYLISIKRMSDSTKIYSIKDVKTKEQMNIAVRGCASV